MIVVRPLTRSAAKIAQLIALDDLPVWLDRTLAGQVRGRTVIDMRR